MNGPKLTPEAFEGVTQLFERALTLAISRSAIDRTCLSCVHFHEPTEACGKWGNVKVPARTIVNACEAWEQNPHFKDPF